MSYLIAVFVDKSHLPTMDALLVKLAAEGFALTLETDYDWARDSGWLPMQWRGEASGCEVEVSKISKKDQKAAKAVGMQNADTTVLISMRGWSSLQVGTVFAAALAVLTEGCIAEDEKDGCLLHGDALGWERDSIAGIDLNAEKTAALDQDSGNAPQVIDIPLRFEQALQALIGQKVERAVHIGDRLAFYFAGGQQLSGNVWRVIARDGRRVGPTRHAEIRARQIVLSQVWWGVEPTDEQLQAYQAENVALDMAVPLDEQDRAVAMAEVETWPEDLVVVNVRWSQPNTVELFFGDNPVYGFEFSELSELGTLGLLEPPLTFVIAGDGPRL